MIRDIHLVKNYDVLDLQIYLTKMANLLQSSSKQINLWALQKLSREVQIQKQGNRIDVAKLIKSFKEIPPTQSYLVNLPTQHSQASQKYGLSDNSSITQSQFLNPLSEQEESIANDFSDRLRNLSGFSRALIKLRMINDRPEELQPILVHLDQNDNKYLNKLKIYRSARTNVKDKQIILIQQSQFERLLHNRPQNYSNFAEQFQRMLEQQQQTYKNRLDNYQNQINDLQNQLKKSNQQRDQLKEKTLILKSRVKTSQSLIHEIVSKQTHP